MGAARYKPYPAYKPSGVEWLGDIPEGWDVKRLKYLCKVETGSKNTEDAKDDGTFPFFVRSQTVERINSYCADCEAVLTAGDGVGVGKVFHYVEGKFDCHQRVYMLKEFNGITGRYLFYYLSTNFYNVAMNGNSKSTVDSLRLPQFLNFEFVFPNLKLQTKVAAFLDFETGKTDALIAKQERLIALLEEKRQAVISHAVTKGLNPNAPLRPSGIDWLGDVPEHWEVKKFSHCSTIRSGQVDPRKLPYREYTLIAPNHIESGTGRILSAETAAEQGADSGKYQCAAGEVIYSKIRPALAKACLVPHDETICSADMYPISGVNGLSNKFLFWNLLSQWFTSLTILESDRVAMPKINREKLAEVSLPVPPIDEQGRICDFMEKQTMKLDTLVAKAQSAITLLKERRTALISAAVTGKIDIRDWQPPQPLSDTDLSTEILQEAVL